MELKDFISETLIEIAQGVNMAKEKYKELGGDVNPHNLKQIEGGLMYGKEIPIQSVAKLLCNVQFEIALTDGNKEGSSNGIGVFLGYFSAGGKTDSANEHQSFTRVKFNVPVQLP